MPLIGTRGAASSRGFGQQQGIAVPDPYDIEYRMWETNHASRRIENPLFHYRNWPRSAVKQQTSRGSPTAPPTGCYAQQSRNRLLGWSAIKARQAAA